MTATSFCVASCTTASRLRCSHVVHVFGYIALKIKVTNIPITIHATSDTINSSTHCSTFHIGAFFFRPFWPTPAFPFLFNYHVNNKPFPCFNIRESSHVATTNAQLDVAQARSRSCKATDSRPMVGPGEVLRRVGETREHRFQRCRFQER